MLPILRLLLALPVVLGRLEGEKPFIRSRVSEGRSSVVSFPTALADHKIIESGLKELNIDPGSRHAGDKSKETVTENMQAFFKSYGRSLGIKEDEMRDGAV
jgi:hypothetical protein